MFSKSLKGVCKNKFKARCLFVNQSENRARSAPTPKASSELFLHRKSYNPLSREPNDEDRMSVYNELSGYGKFTGM